MIIIHYITWLIIGFLLGVFYFGGLWWTTKKIITAKRPAILLMGSFFVRVMTVLYVLYIFADSNFMNILTIMIGFMGSRFIIASYIKSKEK